MPYKKIVAFGDSFTRGDELADCDIVREPNCRYSLSTWPAILAGLLEADYECFATGGRGNQWISWMVTSNILTYKDCLFVINWTYFGRFDFLNQDDWWDTATPNNNDKSFYQKIDSDIWNLLRNLQIIYTTVCLLEQNNVNFIMTCQDSIFNQTFNQLRPKAKVGGNWTQNWTRTLNLLQAHVIQKIQTFEGLPFREWAAKHGYAIGTHGHPLEKAHAEAAKYINTHVIEGKTNEH